MTVKDVFKILIGTILVIVISMLLVEYLNVTSTSTFMKGILTNSIENSCDFFAQETYKKANTGNGGKILNSGNAESIKDSTGVEAVSGTFFLPAGGTKEQVYNTLYGKNSPFHKWYNKNNGAKNGDGIATSVKGVWRNLDMLASGLGINTISLSAAEKTMGKSYKENMMTPLNLGIPYLDENTVERICRYNLVANFSEGKANNIVTDPNKRAGGAVKRLDIDTGSYVQAPRYVQYRGFRIYYDSFDIEKISYIIYDITDETQRKEFFDVTNIQASNLYGGFIEHLDERKYIGVAKIDYNIDIDYVGMTPAAKVLNFANSFNVNGYGGIEENSNYGAQARQGAATFSNRAGSQPTPVSDSIYYYIVR